MRNALRRFARAQKQRARTLLYPVQRRLRPTLERSTPRAVMLFDPSTKYGGWIDRVKGMISVYELARLTGRSFCVHAGPTFPLTDFIEPATFDWRIDRDVRWHPLDTTFHVSRDRKTPAFATLRTCARGTLFVETNLDYLSMLHPDADTDVMWGERYRALFRPTSAFAATIAPLVDHDAIAVHARFTSLVGDFKDVSDRQLPADDQRRLLDACLTRLAALATTSERVLVFSDSMRFLREAPRVAANIVILPGEPTHIDHEARVKDALRKTLLDFYVMLHCRRIIQLRLGPMYDSNFSRYAARVNGIPFEASI